MTIRVLEFVELHGGSEDRRDWDCVRKIITDRPNEIAKFVSRSGKTPLHWMAIKGAPLLMLSNLFWKCIQKQKMSSATMAIHLYNLQKNAESVLQRLYRYWKQDETDDKKDDDEERKSN